MVTYSCLLDGVSVANSCEHKVNAPHSLSTALDSLYMAWCKTKYPEITYTTLLEYYAVGDKRDIGKIAEGKAELEKIGQKILPISLGQDNTCFKKTAEGYTQSMMGLKGANIYLAKSLADIPATFSMLQAYEYIKSILKEEDDDTSKQKHPLNKRHWKVLCKIGYFPNTNGKKAEIYIPEIYDRIYTKKQFTETSLAKLKLELGVEFDILPYCSRRTAKTYYLHPDKKLELCEYVYSLIECSPYTIKEQILNEISTYGFVSSPEQYLQHKIISGRVTRVNTKANTIQILTPQEKEVDIGIPDGIGGIKKDDQFIMFSYDAIKISTQLVIKAKDYIVY